MLSTWMFAVVLAASADGHCPQGGPPVEAPDPSASEAAASRSAATDRLQARDELRAAFAEALQKSARRAKPDPFEVVPELTGLYGSVDDVEAISFAEKSRMKRALKNRLEELRDRVIRNAVKEERRRRRASPRTVRVRRPTTLPGDRLSGGEAARAMELVELIQNTIAPETWDVNGGNGSIRYFSLLKVLVVRQTGEVHHQIGKTLPQLGK